MDDWRSEKATEKQLKYIAEMREMSEMELPEFEGTTKGEAADYIDRHWKAAHEDWGWGASYG